ncbi:hypothetical protein NBO_6g0055 [Nosema bombycis CQ1]|uniref:Uncharacterized protein n=1 Tax=Nosema bombycis (strain CQ1 / CVCC 102059) TaxID=578461 RepID=R0MQZ5_NOSB1|nr:hypothetical protein NBO_6g0055 [Nosema bombycis CQ1]|eukprot:EOB15303.1 hypothetical protein NBO_6g0055 [Nosema bombycis CQ1]
MNFDDSNNLSDLKNNMTDIKNNLTDLKSNLTDKKSVFGDIKSNITEKKSNPFSFSFDKENSKGGDDEGSKGDINKSDITGNNQSDVTESTKSEFKNEDVNNQSVITESAKSVFGDDGKFNQSVSTINLKSPFSESTKSAFTESTKSVFGKSVGPFEKPESVKNVFNKEEISKSPFTKNNSFESITSQANLSQPASGFKPTPFQPNPSQPSHTLSTKPSLDSVDDIISAILSIKTNSVTINNYKINNITDRLESQIYSSMSKLKRINDIKREIESNLLIMINNLDTFNKIDSKSIEDSMRYFDEVIERRTRHKTPLIYNSPIIEPDLRKINQIPTTLEEDLSKLNLNVLTQIKLEPVYLIDKLKIKYKEEDKEVCEEKESVFKEEVKEGRPQSNPNFYVKNNPEKESNLQPTITQLNTQPNISKLITQPTPQPIPQPFIQPTTPQPTQPLTNPFQSSPSQPNSSDIFNRVLGSSIPVIKKEETNNKPPSAFSKFASSHNLFK